MSNDPSIDDLLAPFSQDALRAALQEAFRRGEDSMRTKLLFLLDAQLPSTTVPATAPAGQPESEVFSDAADDEADAHARAPRGLAREVIDLILRSGPPLSTSDIQKLAAELDQRVSSKTVYNELNRGRDKLYRLSMGRWSMINPAGSAAPRDEMRDWIGTP